MSTSARTESCDVAVVGAGSSGSYLAGLLARDGLRVVLLEARRFEKAGAWWINGVAPGMLERAGLGAPPAGEIFSVHAPLLLLGPGGSGRIVLEASPLLELRMDRFCARLRRQALEAGVQVVERVTGVELLVEAGRVVGLRLSGAPPGGRRRSWRLRAGLVVDASGPARSLAGQHPQGARLWPAPPPRLVCRAAQQVLEITDRQGALAFCERWRVEPGTTVMFSCPRGGWSILNVRIDAGLERADLLAGCLASKAGSGLEMIADFRRQNTWLGRRLSGGSGDISLRRPYPRPWAPGLALVGEAACQVFGLHGSGTASGLLAARKLAGAVVGGTDPGSRPALASYGRAVALEPGLRCAAAEPLVRLLDDIGVPGVEQLFDAGIVDAETLAAGLEQRLAWTGSGELVRRSRKLAGQGRLALRVAAALLAAGTLAARQLLRSLPGTGA